LEEDKEYGTELGTVVMLAAAVIEKVCSYYSTIFSTMRVRKRLQLQVIRGVITIYHLSAIHIYIETYSSKDYLYNCFFVGNICTKRSQCMNECEIVRKFEID